MLNSAAGSSVDLFGDTLVQRREPVSKPRCAPELAAARMLCVKLRHKQARPEKMRIAHLIYLNLQSMLKHDA